MAIPTYQIIAANEIDPESPLTSSLVQRLRDNCLALLGVDNADPTPNVTFQPSSLNETRRVGSNMDAYPGGYTFTGYSDDLAIGDVAATFEKITATFSFNYAFTGPIGPALLASSWDLVSVTYVAGVPTSVRVVTSVWTGRNPVLTYTDVPVDNAFHQLIYDDVPDYYWFRFDLKFRVSAGVLYAQQRYDLASNYGGSVLGGMNATASSYVAKV